MEADARLVQDIHHADQARSDLRCQPDALRLTARKRWSRTVKRQVVQTDVEQEAQSFANLLQHFTGDLQDGSHLAVRHAP